jgi:lipopolysaccharide export system protein LptA
MSARTMISSRRPDRAGSGTTRNVFAAVALVAMLAAADAAAQKSQSPQNQGPPNALQGFSQNRDQPVNIQSDSLVVRDKDKVATFTGNVHVTQGDTEMRSKALVVYYVDPNKPGAGPANALKAPAPGPQPGSSDAAQQIRRIEATGGVTVTQKDQNALGDTGIFDMQANTVQLNGNVVVVHGKDVLRGQRLTVDLGTGVSKVEGGRVDVLIGSTPSGGLSLPTQAPAPIHPN